MCKHVCFTFRFFPSPLFLPSYHLYPYDWCKPTPPIMLTSFCTFLLHSSHTLSFNSMSCYLNLKFNPKNTVNSGTVLKKFPEVQKPCRKCWWDVYDTYSMNIGDFSPNIRRITEIRLMVTLTWDCLFAASGHCVPTWGRLCCGLLRGHALRAPHPPGQRGDDPMA